MTEESTQIVKLADLKPYPTQSIYYGDCSAADDEELTADLKKRGQQSPIVVMPEGNAAGLAGGTILDGCRRARLMQANGQTEAWVLVRHDLKDADAATVENEFLKYNITRRQLHPLDRARIVKRLYELERKKPSCRFGWLETDAVRDRVGKTINMSGRHLLRYMRVLETPKTIQDAVRDGRLKLVLASRVAALPEAQQRELAEAIDCLTEKRQINQLVSEALGVSSELRHVKANDAAASFAKQLDKGIADLADRVDEVGPRCAVKHLAILTRGAEMIQGLIRRAHSAKASGTGDEPAAWQSAPPGFQ